MPSETRIAKPQKPYSWIEKLRALGPGIMMASLSVGGSHLVISTKAGAIYGWQLAGLILLVNVLKYPFFRAAYQYTLATGNSMIQGYYGMGRGYLGLYILVCLVCGVVNCAAFFIFSASLLSYFLPATLPLTLVAGALSVACFLILLIGNENTLSRLSKIIMVTLVIATISAALIAAAHPTPIPEDFQAPSLWNAAAFSFIVIMMGWMPAPMEVTCITSLWLKQQCQERPVNAKIALFDFNLGYIGTALLAIVFLALGALVLHGHDAQLKSSGVGFTHQFVSMYTAAIGQWSHYLIASIAFLCIFGTTLTFMDGYGRSLAESYRLLRYKTAGKPSNSDYFWVALLFVSGMCIVVFFSTSLMPMLHFAMILSFIVTPILALLNHRLVTQKTTPKAALLRGALHKLSLVGLVYLFGFLLAFLIWQFWY